MGSEIKYIEKTKYKEIVLKLITKI